MILYDSNMGIPKDLKIGDYIKHYYEKSSIFFAKENFVVGKVVSVKSMSVKYSCYSMNDELLGAIDCLSPEEHIEKIESVEELMMIKLSGKKIP